MTEREIDLLKKGNKILVEENNRYKEVIKCLKEIADANGCVSRIRLKSVLMLCRIDG